MDFSKTKSKDLIEIYNQINAFVGFLNKEESDSKQMLENMKKETKKS
jgi:hypothetical protein